MISFISPSLVLYLFPLAATFFLNALVFALGSLRGVVAFESRSGPLWGLHESTLAGALCKTWRGPFRTVYSPSLSTANSEYPARGLWEEILVGRSHATKTNPDT
jgi:hypothetical protein